MVMVFFNTTQPTALLERALKLTVNLIVTTAKTPANYTFYIVVIRHVVLIQITYTLVFIKITWLIWFAGVDTLQPIIQAMPVRIRG